MFEQYQNEVVSMCRNKLAANQLPHLNAVSPAMLRQECLNIYKERHDPKKDDVALRMFFGPDNKDKGYLKIIDAHPTEKFKALSVFFKRPNDKKPDQKNLELLAWLIDFEGRPYQPKKGYDISTPLDKKEETVVADKQSTEAEIQAGDDKIKKQNESLEAEDISHTKDKEQGIKSIIGNTIYPPIVDPTIHSTRWQIPKKFHKTVYAFTAAAFVLASTYVIVKSTKKQCMYWNGNQYEVVACDEKQGNFSIIAFDEPKKDRLKRILHPDTLTINSVRKVWYNKVWADSLDFYTDSGAVPTDSRKRLMPMTGYMLNKYIIQKKLAKQP